MASFGRPFSADSPVLAVPPQSAHQASFEKPPCGQGVMSQESQVASPATAPGTRPMAGRKRSRDEAAPNLADEASEPMHIESTAAPEDDWEYGEGMTLIKPNQSYFSDATTQSGTWLEERKAAEDEAHQAAAAARALALQERPPLRSNKSQRLDQTALPSPGGDAGIGAFDTQSSASARAGATADSSVPSPPDSSGLPVVDDFTLLLGVGWRRISDDEHIQAAARGWARYLENHYPLSAVTIRLESRGLQAYLAEATEGFFLFAEDLRQGQFVSQNAESALQNLKSSPPVFEGHETLFASESLGDTVAAGRAQAAATNVADIQGFQLAPQSQSGMEVEMS